MKKPNAILAILSSILRLVINCLVLFVGVYAIYKFTNMSFDTAKSIATAQIDDKKNRAITVDIPKGANTADIAAILKKEGLITSEAWFRVESKFEKMDGQFKAGKFYLNTGMSDKELMTEIAKGSVSNDEMVRITIPEGFTVTQIARTLEDAGLFEANEFREAMNEEEFNYSFISKMPDRGGAKLEGYLFPDTYFFLPDATPVDVISKMLTRFEEVYKEESQQKTVDFSIDEIIIRASIVEAEIKVPHERPLCVSVMQNRMDIGMPLQMDATVSYGLGEKKDKLYISDLEVPSPYNTYKNLGLPVGPICNPGRASIKAALNPADTNYLYYVVDDLEIGSHEFTETYEEFLAAKERYKNMQ